MASGLRNQPCFDNIRGWSFGNVCRVRPRPQIRRRKRCRHAHWLINYNRCICFKTTYMEFISCCKKASKFIEWYLEHYRNPSAPMQNLFIAFEHNARFWCIVRLLIKKHLKRMGYRKSCKYFTSIRARCTDKCSWMCLLLPLLTPGGPDTTRHIMACSDNRTPFKASWDIKKSFPRITTFWQRKRKSILLVANTWTCRKADSRFK